MEFEQILALIDHVSDSKLTSFRYEAENLKLSMKCGEVQTIAVSGVDMSAQAVVSAVGNGPMAGGMPAAEGIAVGTENVAQNGETTEVKGNLVKSPLVGTFYAAPSENAQPFVKVGDQVKKGQVLAIVEAMKLMNEIESEFDGEIAEIYVANGESVEYGQSLFRIV